MKKYIFLILSFTIFNSYAQEELYKNNFSLSDVELLDGSLKDACDLNVRILLEYDIDRLLAPFLRDAGLTPKASSFENWIDLDGHIGGHYLSALSIHYAATKNEEIKFKLDYFIAELKRCQDKNGDGYVGGVPNGKALWNKIKARNWAAVNDYWVPWYNIHKTFAGLRDAWAYAGDETAKEMFLSLCDWGLTIINPLTDSEMESMLNTEFGGMNEVYADAYQMTLDTKYLLAAKRFSHKLLYNSMANRVDNLNNMHANTQVPKAVGYQRVAEVSNDANYTRAATFFWETVVNNRSLAFGGNSRREHFPSKQDHISYTQEREGPETCNTNNMLKLSEGLFRMTFDAKYTDFYERAMYNHILSSQHPEHGGYVYFTPARPRHYRVYSAPNEAMWCCVGTGMENHGKYGEFIYAHNYDSLFVNLFVASKLTWQEKGVTLTQNTNFPYEEESYITINTDAPKNLKLLIRHPWWVDASEMEIIYNGKNYAENSNPSTYIEIDNVWNDGDIITIKTPMKTKIAQLPDVPSYISVMYGPILLATKTGTEDLNGLIAGNDRWGHIASGKLLPVTEAPFSIGTKDEIQQKIDALEKIENEPLAFDASDLFENTDNKKFILEPFFKIHDSRYLMYWLSMTQSEYKKYIDEMAAKEAEKMILEDRTVDMVTPGEQQPEVDHQMQSYNSNSGYHQEEGWRDATNNGWFSYNLLTEGRTDLLLFVRYWGNEGGNRKFYIKIDNQLLITENVTGKWNKNEFINVEYTIPTSMLEGKSSITVKFECTPNNIAGGVFKVRLVKPLQTSIKYNKNEQGIIYSKNQELIFKDFNPNSKIRIYNISGILINQFEIQEKSTTIKLSKGIYIIDISGNRQDRVIVE